MADLRELYQQLIIDHGRKPRNFGILEHANRIKQGYNPLCGDELTVYLQEKDGVIDAIRFEGSGCAISMASASLMTQALQGKTVAAARQYFEDFHHMVMDRDATPAACLGKLAVLQGVAEYPARVKCATLCWHTVMAALTNNPAHVSTES